MALLGRAFRMGQGWGRRRLLPLALFFVAFALPAVWIVLTRVLPASDATLHYYAALPGSPAGGVTTVRASGTLKPGDQVIAIDARPVSEWLEAEAHERSHKGTRLTYTVVRDHRTEQVPVTLGDYPLAPVVRGTGGAALLVLVTLAVSVVVFLRRPRDGAARALLAIPILLLIGSTSWPFGPQVVDLIRPYGQWPYVVGGVANALVWGVVLHLALVLPVPLHLVQRRRWLLSAG